MKVTKRPRFDSAELAFAFTHMADFTAVTIALKIASDVFGVAEDLYDCARALCRGSRAILPRPFQAYVKSPTSRLFR